MTDLPTSNILFCVKTIQIDLQIISIGAKRLHFRKQHRKYTLTVDEKLENDIQRKVGIQKKRK
jgi:hypothetical protein